MTSITSQQATIEDQLIFWHEAPSDETTPTLYLHGVPSNADDWLPFLQQTGGFAPDFPGFGRSVKHDPQQSTMYELADFVERFVRARSLDKINLVVHDWGGIGLLYAMRFPERINRLVAMNCVTFLPGYRWHAFARLWRTPGIGELSVASLNTPLGRILAKHSLIETGKLPEELIESVQRYLDRDTQRAILSLYRSADEHLIAREGEKLAHIQAPALVLWGERDPYISPAFGYALSDALPNATLKLLPEAAHWPWLDQPEVVEIVSSFLTSDTHHP